MALKTLDDLFVHMIRDIYHAEKQALRGMRQMSRKASSEELKQLLEMHREETEGQVETLDKVFEQLGMRARGTSCEAIQGIMEETKEIMDEAESGPTRDAGIIAAAQAVEHYEITRYGTMVSWARALGRDEVAELLMQTLEQEKAADQRLTELAETTLNEQARSQEGAGGEAESEMMGEGEEGEQAPRRGNGKKSGRGGRASERSLEEMSEEEIEELKTEEDMEEEEVAEGGGSQQKRRARGSSRSS